MEKNSLTLLCGFSRSGTTWLSKILDSALTTLIVSEPDKRFNSNILFGQVPHCIGNSQSIYSDKYRNGINEITDSVFCNLRSFPFFKKNYIEIPYDFYNISSIVYQAMNYCLAKASYKSLKMPSFFFNNKKHVDLVWKSVNQSSNLNFLQDIIPDIKIIYIYRNPFSSIASMLLNNQMTLDEEDFRRIMERKESLFFKRNKIDFKELSQWEVIKKRAFLWRVECENAYFAGKDNKNFYGLTYEKFVSNPFEETEKIFKWLGWELFDEVQEFLLESTGQKEPAFLNRLISSGYFGVYRKPGIDFTKWKKVINQRDYEMICSTIKGSPILDYWSDDIIKL